MVDQEIRVLGDENIIANPKNSQKQYPLTFKAVPNVIVYGRKKDNLNFTVPIPEGVNFNFNLDRTSIIFADNFNLEEYSYIMVKNPFEEIQDFFYVSSLEELDPTGKEFNEFNNEVVKWLRRLVNIISNRCMIFETTLFKDLNNFPNIKSGQTFIRTEDGWTGITIRDINSELDIIFNKYVEEINKKIQEHQVKMNELLEQWKQDIQKYAENVKQYEIVRIVTQSGHGFVFEPVMYSISQRKFVKALFPHGADGIAVRVDDNNFRLVWAGRVEIPTAAKDTQQRDFVLGEYYFLGEGSNGGIQREKPDTYYQHLFQVMYSDELQHNIADVLLSVPINQKGKRWDVGEAKTTVNDIEELKMSDFPVGKVVEVLGYYKAGDGADHKRIIKAEDDGSGVQLRNGKWANIVHNGEVNVSWFGAKGNGKDDDYNYIKKTLDFSNNIFLDNNKTYICNSTLELSHKKIRLGVSTTLKKTSQEDEPIIWCNGDSFVIEGTGQTSSHIVSEVPITYGVVCVGNLGLDNVGRNVLYGNIRSLSMETPNTKDGTSTLAFVSPQYNGLANYFHHINDIQIIGGDCGILMYGWSNGNNFSNIQLYKNKSKGFYFKDLENKTPLDNNISNIFHHSSNNAITLYMEGGATNIITGLNCEQGGDTAKSIYTTKEIQNNTFIISSNTNRGYTILGENNIIDTFDRSSFRNLDLKKISINKKTIQGIKYSELKEDTKYKLIKIDYSKLARKEVIALKVLTSESNASGVPCKVNCETKYFINADGTFETYSFTENSYDLKKIGNSLYVVTKTYNNGTNTSNGYMSLTAETQYRTQNVVSFEFGEIQEEINKPIAMLNTLYHGEKMKQEGVYDDYISYMDEKTLYDKQQRKLSEQRQLAYEEALKENPELTFEEFISVQPMTLNFVDEPQPSEALKKFMDKYL